MKRHVTSLVSGLWLAGLGGCSFDLDVNTKAAPLVEAGSAELEAPRGETGASEAGADSASGHADSGRSELAGDYLLRTDVEFVSEQSLPGGAVKVASRATHFGLTRLVTSGDGLEAIEHICHITYQHDCQEGCTSIASTIAPAAIPLYRMQDLSRRYTFLDGGRSFSTNAASLRLGWDGPVDSLPTQLSDASVWNASDDAISKGLYVRVQADMTGAPFTPMTVDCYYNLVARFTSKFAGELKDGLLDGVSADMDTADSDLTVLNSAGGGVCSGVEPALSVSRSSVRFTRVQGGEDFWDCPDEAVFRAAMPDP